MSIPKILFCWGFFQTLLFWKVQPSMARFPVFNVTSCPRNAIDWAEASARLNCSLHYNKKLERYHCLPDSKLTTLVEFCYDRIRPLVSKGYCVVLHLSNTLLNEYNCSDFEDGCPDKNYDSDTIYKYPSCLMIDTKKQCYCAENKCTTACGLYCRRKSTETQRKEDKAIQDICTAAIVVSICIVLFTSCAICIFVWIKQKRKKRKKNSTTHTGENEGLIDHLQFSNTSTPNPRVLFGKKVCMRSTVVEGAKQTAITNNVIKLRWEKKKGDVYEEKKTDDHVTCCTEPPNPTLTIRRAMKEDTGEYKLRLMNTDKMNKEEDIDFVEFKLSVLGFKPKVKILGGTSVEMGDTASLIVLQSSFPEAFRIKWYKAKMKPQSDVEIERTEIKISDKKYKGSTFDFLVINDADKEDNRRYIVKVKNILGESCDTIDLKVEDREDSNIEEKTDDVLSRNTFEGETIGEQPDSTLTLKKDDKNDLISISNVRRVYHISDAGSGNLWISDGGRLMKIDKYGYLIQLVDVGRFNTGCHSVSKNPNRELFYLKKEEVFKLDNAGTPIPGLNSHAKTNLVESLKESKTESIKWVAWCIHCSAINNDILVGLHEKNGLKGKILRFTEGNRKRSFGTSLCKPLYMTENMNGDVIVSDAGHRAVVILDECKEKFKYAGNSTSPSRFFPTGVCTDESRCILVCIYENNESNIHLLNEKGAFLKKMLDKEDCTRGPCAICIVDDYLYLGQESCQDIQVYTIKRESRNRPERNQ